MPIDASPSHPAMCEISMPRDCSNNFCVVTAISNFTMQLWDKNGAVDLFPTTLSSHLLDEKTLALLFLIHFVGDIHQPLHTCGKARGGNDFPIHFGNSRNQQETHVGFSQNMHGLWDYMILEKCINENYGASAGVFINAIVKELGKDISRLLSLSLSFLHIHTSSLYSRIRKVGKGKKRVG